MYAYIRCSAAQGLELPKSPQQCNFSLNEMGEMQAATSFAYTLLPLEVG